jgi:hypothetical protein
MFTPIYGSFSSGTTQGIPLASPVSISYDRTDIASGIGLTGPLPTDRILVATTGIYRLITSVQLNHTGGGLGDITIYPIVNSIPVPNSASYTEIRANEELVVTVEVLLSLTAGDAIAIIAYSNSTGNEVSAVPSPSPGIVPDAPSIITIIQRIA